MRERPTLLNRDEIKLVIYSVVRENGWMDKIDYIDHDGLYSYCNF